MSNDQLSPLSSKIISYFMHNGTSTLPEMARDLEISVPTVTKVTLDLYERGFVSIHGKLDTQGGRRPNVYGLNPQAGYFVGVELMYNSVNLALSNLVGKIVEERMSVPFITSNDDAKSLEELCRIISSFVEKCAVTRDSVMYGCINISGRVNPTTGYSYSRYHYSEMPLSDIMSQHLGFPICVENDTHAMARGEYLSVSPSQYKDVLFVNISWGLAMGIIIDGKLYEGKSGFSGELGHMSAFDNEILCHCGKKGCLETEVSGRALHRMILEKVADGSATVLAPRIKNGENISLADIVNAAVNDEDSLAIELIEQIGIKLGRQIASMINLFNPGQVIVGGTLSQAGDYLMTPLKLAVRKYSLNLVNKDTKITISKLGNQAGIVGACLTARARFFE